MRILVWVPSRPYEAVEPLWRITSWAQSFDRFENWTWGPTKHQVLIIGDWKSTALSISRSVSIDWAKKVGADWLLMTDCDTCPARPLNEMIGYLNQAAARNFGAIISPAVAKAGTVGVLPPLGMYDGDAYPSLSAIPENLSEIRAGTGGFICISKACLSALVPVSQMTYRKNKDAPIVNVPNYYEWTEATGESEDYAMLRRIRESTSFKLGADTRLKTLHFKAFGIPSWSGIRNNPTQA